MAFTRTTTINAAPGGDSVKQAVLDLDTDLTGAFTHLNTVQADVDANQVTTDAHSSATAAHGVTGAIVGTTSAQTLTNKTINLTSNALTGTTAQFNTALSDGDFATLAGTQTLTNKTLVAPALGTPASGDLRNCSLAVAPAIGGTTPSTGVFTTLSSTGATLVGTATDPGYGAKIHSTAGISLGNTAVANGNVLDWYEEGTFTPSASGTTTAGTGTYSVRQGYYTRIGREVNFRILISWSAHTGTGGLNITGLPFTSSNATNHYPNASFYYNGLLVGAGKILTSQIAPSSTLISLFASDPSGEATAAINNGTFDTAVASLSITGTYMV